jgi:hypothetical protein
MTLIINAPRIHDCRIRVEGTKVVLVVDGKEYLELPWDAAMKVGRAMVSCAKEAEELAKALKIAHDQAFIIRAGLPFGLTNHPAIHKEAGKLAAHDRDLRKMPGGIKSTESVGKPRLIKMPPTEEQKRLEEKKHE